MNADTPAPERDPECQCARCGSSAYWDECEFCGGEGAITTDDDCEWCYGEGCDSCIRACGWCDEYGGWWRCLSGREWCEANPLPGREHIESTALRKGRHVDHAERATEDRALEAAAAEIAAEFDWWFGVGKVDAAPIIAILRRHGLRGPEDRFMVYRDGSLDRAPLVKEAAADARILRHDAEVHGGIATITAMAAAEVLDRCVLALVGS